MKWVILLAGLALIAVAGLCYVLHLATQGWAP